MKFLQMKKKIYLEHALFVLTVLSILFIVNSIFKLQTLTQSALEKETFTFQVSKKLVEKVSFFWVKTGSWLHRSLKAEGFPPILLLALFKKSQVLCYDNKGGVQDLVSEKKDLKFNSGFNRESLLSFGLIGGFSGNFGNNRKLLNVKSQYSLSWLHQAISFLSAVRTKCFPDQPTHHFQEVDLFYLQNCFISFWHRFSTVLEKILRDCGPYWQDSIIVVADLLVARVGLHPVPPHPKGLWLYWDLVSVEAIWILAVTYLLSCSRRQFARIWGSVTWHVVIPCHSCPKLPLAIVAA